MRHDFSPEGLRTGASKEATVSPHFILSLAIIFVIFGLCFYYRKENK